MKIKKIASVLFLIIMTSHLTYCGQKGDLVRPQPKEQQEK